MYIMFYEIIILISSSLFLYFSKKLNNIYYEFDNKIFQLEKNYFKLEKKHFDEINNLENFNVKQDDDIFYLNDIIKDFSMELKNLKKHIKKFEIVDFPLFNILLKFNSILDDYKTNILIKDKILTRGDFNHFYQFLNEYYEIDKLILNEENIKNLFLIKFLNNNN